ncbi:glycosyltransferase family 2 protein [Bradyrhizobium sp.]|uniref:glycosyltransferase family 2 protein n=1 Tax=Bradyrhizobium sp. TaxID=376 RepID=UPI0026119C10|nr:glycosyltransferase family 2 protein [Bradyrhizobium sp.]
MKKRISLLLPTRGRPQLVERFLQSVAAQSAHPELIEVILCVDDDDPASHCIASSRIALKTIIVPRQTMGAYNAICLENATGEITIAVNDDIIIRTKGWDEKIRALDKRYVDGIYLGYPNDLFKGEKVCTFPVLSRKTCEVLAEPYPGIYKGAFIDVHLMDIFRRLERRGYPRMIYVEDIVFEHVHYRTNPELLDATYRERARFGDDATFIALAPVRRMEADRLFEYVSRKIAREGSRPLAPVVTQMRFFGIVSLCYRAFLCDSDLPATWRTYLFGYMVARHYVNWFSHLLS